MINANKTIVIFYLTTMDSFLEYLSKKYTETSSEKLDYFKLQILHKIVRMFHTLNMIVSNDGDLVSARCVLRGLLDSIATYSFIYQREDKNEILFRHYLYILDGLKTYKESVINGILEKVNAEYDIERQNNDSIEEILNVLSSHPYSLSHDENVNFIIRNANWRYKSLKDIHRVEYVTMYNLLGLDKTLANYYQRYLSHFSHGLHLSNDHITSLKQLESVLYECLPLAEKMIIVIQKSFPKEDMFSHMLQTDAIINMSNQPDFNMSDYLDFAKSKLRRDKIYLIK